MRRGTVRLGCVSGIESPSVRLTKTVIALGVAALSGCELVAGIQDLTNPGVSADAGSGDDATVAQGDSGSDAAQSPDAAADQSVVGTQDDAGSDSDASPSAPGDALTDAAPPMGDVTTPPDAGVGTGVDAPEVTADADAGPVAIPGPDGGPLSGDAGPLLGELIDDIDSEKNPGFVPIRGGRSGTWFTYDDDAPGGVLPAPNSAPALSVGNIVGWDGNASNLAVHVTGNGLAAYAGTGFNLNVNNNVVLTYDASAYRGFVFWGRIGGDSGTALVQFAVPDLNTSEAGGVCTAASDGGSVGCSDYFSKNFSFTPTWQQFVVYYSQLKQAGFGLPKNLPGLDAAQIYSCQFQLGPGAPFDVWIDDVYFIDK